MPGSRNRWRKANLEQLREHIQLVFDERLGGIEEYLEELARKDARSFVALLKEVLPKKLEVEHDGEVVFSWAGDKERAARS